MASLQVVRWTRYGKDRVYVNTEGGTNVDWVDLKTGERHLAVPTQAAEFEAAVHGYLTPAMPAEPEIRVANSTRTDAAMLQDLAFNVPGQAALAHAESLQQRLR